MPYEAAVMMAFSMISFLLLHFGIQLGKSENKIYKSSQMLFILLGFYMILLTVTIARTVADSGGASEGTLDTIDVAITVLTWLVVAFIFIFIMVFIYTILMSLRTRSKESSKLPTV